MIKPIGDLQAALVGYLLDVQANLDVIDRDCGDRAAVRYRKIYPALGIRLIVLAENDQALPDRAANQQPCRE